VKKLLLFLLLAIGVSSCEVDSSYDCYRFEIRTEITYIPYRPSYVDYYYYDRCGLSYYMAQNEAYSNEYSYSYYQGGYYITETQTCNFRRTW